MSTKRSFIPIPPPAPLPEAEELDARAVLDGYLRGDYDLVCILGPTASGKTKLAVSLARAFNSILATSDGGKAEIISADSRQVYRGMDIGTGKDLEEYGEIPCHLIDIVPAGARYNIFEYQRDFENAWKDIRSRGCVPILCGGSGLYIEAATCGYAFPEIPPDEELRERLYAEPIEELREKYAELRPVHDPSVMLSKRRLVRALEVALYEQDHPAVRRAELPRKTYFIGTLVSREERNARIDRRLDERLAGGMIEEIRGLIEGGIAAEDLIYYGLEYKFVTQYILGQLSFQQMRTLLSNAIHQFAKRQMTWFRGMEKDGVSIHWVKP